MTGIIPSFEGITYEKLVKADALEDESQSALASTQLRR